MLQYPSYFWVAFAKAKDVHLIPKQIRMLVCMNVEIHLNWFFDQIFSAVMKCFNLTQI